MILILLIMIIMIIINIQTTNNDKSASLQSRFEPVPDASSNVGALLIQPPACLVRTVRSAYKHIYIYIYKQTYNMVIYIYIYIYIMARSSPSRARRRLQASVCDGSTEALPRAQRQNNIWYTRTLERLESCDKNTRSDSSERSGGHITRPDSAPMSLMWGLRHWSKTNNSDASPRQASSHARVIPSFQQPTLLKHRWFPHS